MMWPALNGAARVMKAPHGRRNPRLRDTSNPRGTRKTAALCSILFVWRAKVGLQRCLVFFPVNSTTLNKSWHHETESSNFSHTGFSETVPWQVYLLEEACILLVNLSKPCNISNASKSCFFSLWSSCGFVKLLAQGRTTRKQPASWRGNTAPGVPLRFAESHIVSFLRTQMSYLRTFTSSLSDALHSHKMVCRIPSCWSFSWT